MNNLSGKSVGRYHLIEQLGEGGMATVYRAFDTRLERIVAVKFIRKDMIPPAMMPSILKRFDLEAKLLARFEHESIVEIYDSGEYLGEPYLVMKYLPGGTLKQFIGAQMAYSDVARLLLPVARALAYAHEQGIIHRDVKPANILIDSQGKVKLSDFGIAKVLNLEQMTRLTQTGVIGTFEYMAPEQWVGEAVENSDQYALATIFYELVTGRKPYFANTAFALSLKQVNETLPSPRQFVPDLPEKVEQVLAKTLAKQPEDRYPNMSAFVQVLEEMISHSDTLMTTPTSPTSTQKGTTPKNHHEALKPVIAHPSISVVRRKNSMRWWILGLVIFIFMAVLVVLVKFSPNPNPAATGTTLLITVASETPEKLPPSNPTLFSSNTPEPTPSDTPVPTFVASPTLGIGSAKIAQSDGMVLLYVPPGGFLMGADELDLKAQPDEKPQHLVYLDAFWVDRTEVTNGMYLKCVEKGACPLLASVNNASQNHPVTTVSFTDAVAYCHWVGRRLPTEAEWEKAARGADGRIYPWGNQSFTCELGNANDCTTGTMAVGFFPQGESPYKAVDLVGNVWEWVSDWYQEDYYFTSPEKNPPGPKEGTMRILRGGSYTAEGYPERIRSSNRGPVPLDDVRESFGFRCVVSP